MNTSLAYQEERWEELIGGKAVMMSPASINHVFVAGNIYGIFRDYLRGKSCVPLMDGAKVYLTEEDHLVPDVMVVCDPDKIRHDGVHGAPDLVVEVLSLSTARNDRSHKKDVYARCGVKEYWLVSPNEKFVEVYRSAGTELKLHEIYAIYPDWELARMREEERSAVATHFRCSLFDDLDLALEDVFCRTI